ncbi:cation:proton antiporter [uncultured Methylibium sp.]|uniref:cation:proton antiporter n=1 Tax=uncultured Methylibium sp. TaxID=381093 RepID=UPI0025DEC7B6|nr:cation:proton antiporter [uncultured Methylibium sp.]
MSGAPPSSLHATEQLLFAILLQLAVIVLAARAGGALARRCGQAVVVGEIVVGILLGPSLFGALAPGLFERVVLSAPAQPMAILSQIGLLFLMFQIGMEFDFGHLRERTHRRVVAAVATAGVVAPFVLGIALALAWPENLRTAADRTAFALFMATAFSITAMPVLGRILMECDLTKRPLGVIAISSAAVSDVVGWLLLALVTSLAVAGALSWAVAWRFLGVLAFAALAWWVARPLLLKLLRSTAGPEAGQGDPLPPTLMGAVIALVCLAGMATYQLGVFAIFGGFVMGVLLHRERAFATAWDERVGRFVNFFFLPIYFTYTGLRTDIGGLSGASAWGWCALLIALATLGKFGGCWAAARWAGLDGTRARIVGILMNTRGLMELIVVNVGYDLGVIGRETFTMLVLMAIVSTVVTTPLLRRWLARLEERAVPGVVVAR